MERVASSETVADEGLISGLEIEFTGNTSVVDVFTSVDGPDFAVAVDLEIFCSEDFCSEDVRSEDMWSGDFCSEAFCGLALSALNRLSLLGLA